MECLSTQLEVVYSVKIWSLFCAKIYSQLIIQHKLSVLVRLSVFSFQCDRQHSIFTVNVIAIVS